MNPRDTTNNQVSVVCLPPRVGRIEREIRVFLVIPVVLTILPLYDIRLKIPLRGFLIRFIPSFHHYHQGGTWAGTHALSLPRVLLLSLSLSSSLPLGHHVYCYMFPERKNPLTFARLPSCFGSMTTNAASQSRSNGASSYSYIDCR